MADKIEPMIGDDGEVRELSAEDLSSFSRGAPWALADMRRQEKIEKAAANLIERLDASAGDRFAQEREALRDALGASRTRN